MAVDDTIAQAVPPGGTRMYQEFELEEDTVRSAYHYEQAPAFYYLQTGGEWNVYSCLMWEDGFTITQAQEKKLDKLAECMQRFLQQVSSNSQAARRNGAQRISLAASQLCRSDCAG